MSLQTYALTTVARQKTAMSLSGSSNDTLLEILINVCTDFIEGYCSRRFLKTSISQELHDGPGRSTLRLRSYPIDTSATFLLEERVGTDSWNAIDSSLYVIDAAAGLVTLTGGRFNRGSQAYRVTYTAGFAFDHAGATLESIGYADLEWACWELVKKAFLKRAASTDVASESLGDYSVTYRESTMADPIIREILQKYVRMDDQL